MHAGSVRNVGILTLQRTVPYMLAFSFSSGAEFSNWPEAFSNTQPHNQSTWINLYTEATIIIFPSFESNLLHDESSNHKRHHYIIKLPHFTSQGKKPSYVINRTSFLYSHHFPCKRMWSKFQLGSIKRVASIVDIFQKYTTRYAHLYFPPLQQ
jgi:hypothetical protein